MPHASLNIGSPVEDLPKSVAARLLPVERTLDTLETPAILVDVGIVENNLRRWQERCDAAGIANRPHIKTHRSVSWSQRQVELGARGITCQTIGEAEIMAAAGVEDILITTNILGPAKLQRLGALAQRCRLTVVADSLDVVQAIASAATASRAEINVMVECDTGAGRCGLSDPASVASLAVTISKMPYLSFAGLLTYPAPGKRMVSADALAAMRAACEEAGFPVATISTGGTPDMWKDDGLADVTEYRAGTYIYNDRSQIAVGAASLADCALTVLATVVSRPNSDRAILDAGSKALTSDLLGQDGHGSILQHPEARIYALSEEHGHVDVSACPAKPQIGDRVRVLPNHCCVVANLVDRVFLVSSETLIGALPVEARGRSI